jgi:translocation and assembly module TamB
MGKSFNLALEGASSLAPLRALSRNIDVLKGDASFSLTLTGDWDHPGINGKMDIANGALGLKSVPHRLTSVTARVYADEDRIIIERASGKLSGGDIVLHGTVYLDRFSLKRFFLESNLSNVTVSVSKNFWVHFDGNLSYQGSLQNQNVTGDINIKKARYTERIEWKSWLLQARRKERPKLEAGRLDQTGLNIRVRGTNLSIENNVARAALKMDLILRGTIGQPALIGRLETVNGIVYFRNNEFSLLKGAVDFANPNEISPYFDVLAETRIRNYTVRLALDGYVDQFNLSLSSSPVLVEGDILSLLAVGDVGKNLKGLEGGIGAAEATSFLTGKLQDVAEERLKTVTGVDRLQIDPSISKTTGTVSPRVTLSKKLIGDRLYATYSASADVKDGQIIKLEYLLSKTTSLIGVRDSQGGIGADIKFRFEFK